MAFTFPSTSLFNRPLRHLPSSQGTHVASSRFPVCKAPASDSTPSLSQPESPTISSRRAFLQTLSVLPVTFLLPSTSYAQSSPSPLTVGPPTTPKDLLESFQSLQRLLTIRDYESFRSALRAPPLSGMRTTLNTAAKNMQDEGRRGRELGDYKELIKGIEKIDGLVMKASRNYGSGSEEKQKKEGEAIKNEYEKTVKLFDKFLKDLQEN